MKIFKVQKLKKKPTVKISITILIPYNNRNEITMTQIFDIDNIL